MVDTQSVGSGDYDNLYWSSTTSLNEESDHQNTQHASHQKQSKQPQTKQPESKAKQVPPVKVPETKVSNVGKEPVYGHHINQQKGRQLRSDRANERYPADLETFGHHRPGHVEPVYVRQGRQLGRVQRGNVYVQQTELSFPRDREPVYVKHGQQDVYSQPSQSERVQVQMHYMSRDNFSDHETVLVKHTRPPDIAGYEQPPKPERVHATSPRYTSESALVDGEPVYIKQRSKSGLRLASDPHQRIERYASENTLGTEPDVLYIKHTKKGVPHGQQQPQQQQPPPPTTSIIRHGDGHYASTSQREPLYTSVNEAGDYEGRSRFRTRSEERGEKIYERSRLTQRGDPNVYGHLGYRARAASSSRSQERDSEIYAAEKIRAHVVDGAAHSTDENVYESRKIRSRSAEREHANYEIQVYEASIRDRDDVLSASNDTLSSDMESQSSRRGRKPRRHTVTVGGGGPDAEEEKERKREVFMELLAHRYPEYADKISGHYSDSGYRPKPRTREHQRRRTTIVTYDPDHNRSTEYDSGTVSDMDVPSGGFTRGGFSRSSLPIVRSASLSFERPLGDTLGLVFLVYGDETKKALLPNEITTLDTVRALFVRSFPEKITMDFFKCPKKKIYVLEPKSNIFFQLEDLRDIRDRTVLKVHECDSQEPQKVKDIQPVRGRSVQLAKTRPPPKPAHTIVDDQANRDKYARSQSLPPHIPHGYQSLMDEQRAQWEAEQRSRSQTPDPQRPHTLPMAQQRPKISPDRLPTPERLQLGTIPEHHQMKNGFPEQAVNGFYDPAYHRDPRHLTASPTGSARPFSPQPGVPIYETPYGYHHQQPPGAPPAAPPQTYVAHSVRANTAHAPQRATNVPASDPRYASHNPASNRHSLSFAPMTSGAGGPPSLDPAYQRSPSYRITPEREANRSRSTTPQPGDFETKKRIDQMEAQLASLTAWVHKSVTDKPDRTDGQKSGSTSEGDSYSTSSTLGVERKVVVTGMSDIPVSSSEQCVVVSKEMKACMLAIKKKTTELRADLRSLRRMHQFNKESVAETMYNVLKQIKDVLSSVPSANSQVLRQHRTDLDTHQHEYVECRSKIGKELSDLEANVEELRSDVISRQCRVNMSDVEGMALVLSNITKALAELKGTFPSLQENMKKVMAGEMEIVVNEEKFLKEEPERIEAELKRCKKLTGTLYTLKRLASVQEHRRPQVPAIATSCVEPSEDDKQLVLEHIRSMVPDHDSRLQRLEAAETSRERKKKIVGQQEALKMGKSLELATKALKPMIEGSGSGSGSSSENVSEPQGKDAEKANSARQGESGDGLVYEVIDSKEVKKDANVSLHDSKELARAAFFNTLSPPVSPRDPSLYRTTMDYTVRISPAKTVFCSDSNTVFTSSVSPTSVTSTASDLKSNSSSAAQDKRANIEGGVAKSADVSPTRTKSAFSSIPQRTNKTGSSLTSGPVPGTQDKISPTHSGRKDDGKQKKIPPPPPPRKSSRLPTASVAGSGPGVMNGSAVSPVRPVSPKVSPTSDGAKSIAKDKGSVTNSQQSKSRAGPASSTPKPTPPKKPTTKFEKDLVAGIYANMNRPDLQHQKVSAGSIIRKTAEESSSQGRQLSREDRESSSESTSSSTSLDSQQGVVVVTTGKQRSGSLTSADYSASSGKKPKPPPPERRSSLQQKSHIESHDAAMSTSTDSVLSPAKCLFSEASSAEKTKLLQEQQKTLEQIVSETNEMIKQQQKLSESKNPQNGSAGKPKS